MNKYVLSIWKNYEEPKEWHYDISPLEQYLRNATHYLLEYKKPYYYSPIFIGSQNECDKKADAITNTIKEARNSEDLEKLIAYILQAPEDADQKEKIELCKKIKGYGFNVITALNAKYDFISVIAKEIFFDYVERSLKGEKLEYEPDIEELEKFLDAIEKYIAIDSKQ